MCAVRLFDVEAQQPAVFKTAERILMMAKLYGLEGDFLGGGPRFVKVKGPQEAIDQLQDFIETIEYDRVQAGDRSDDI